MFWAAIYFLIYKIVKVNIHKFKNELDKERNIRESHGINLKYTHKRQIYSDNVILIQFSTLYIPRYLPKSKIF